MKIVILALAACALTQDPQGRVQSSIEKVRAQKSFRTEFTAVIKAPDSDPMELKGETVCVTGGVLFIHYRGSGGDIKRIVRVGDKAWVYHPLAEEWVTAEELGMNGAGRGVQNPDEVLTVLGKHLDKVAAAGHEGGRDAFEVKLKGADIEKMMKEQAQQGSFEWKESSAEAKLQVGADGLIHKLSTQAALVSADPKLKGQTVRYSAEVSVAAYNADFAMRFSVEDPKKKTKVDVAIAPVVLEAIEKQPGVPKELLDEIAKMRASRIQKLIADLGAKEHPVREAASVELKQFGKAAVPALKEALNDKDRAGPARTLLQEIDK